ncbi:LysR family transcriptional regulator [Trinickia dinghuensis]|uniref:LysR family transcriptional regulator n=1 Tax=Trinickia dinghuensis TaxID=2291023 RepID=A0A3D8K642_9BURK|nr:LysR family transcriptional regulator [Trinickia dinghuensis]RDV00335.1 LysR family transcriptional regulator [Trinickia dinghuensis]
MDLLESLRALVLVAQYESFSIAARRVGTSPSVMIKRVNAAEWHLKTQALKRTTRSVALTDAGQRIVPSLQTLVHDFDELMASLRQESPATTGTIRVMVSPGLSASGLGARLGSFLREHVGLRIEVVLLERAVNPAVEGFDIAIDVRSLAYPHVTEIPMFVCRFVLCAAPAYLARKEAPLHPRELQRHQTLVLESVGKKWAFRGHDRTLTVDVAPRLVTGDAQSVLDAVMNGWGIALLPEYLVEQALTAGTLEPLMKEYTPVETWVTALVPDAKMGVPRIHSLIDWLKATPTGDGH